MSDSPKKKSNVKSCLIPGCLGLLLMVLIIGGVSFFAVKSFVNKSVDSFTSETPGEIVSAPIPQEDFTALQTRIDAFQQSLDSGESYELHLNDTEINGLIARSESLQTLKDKIEFEIADSTIKADVSWPMDQFSNVPMLGALSSRYFNGKVELDVFVENGELNVFLLGAEAGGQTLPATFIDAISSENLAKEFANDPEVQEFVEKLESFKVENGQAVFKTR
ncbi:hypothetical protein MLD52_01710 [Puniceicoccaceae bacterium K14]|nr:hypothetical protein [Puniceicoccaceae bacterium K14]